MSGTSSQLSESKSASNHHQSLNAVVDANTSVGSVQPQAEMGGKFEKLNTEDATGKIKKNKHKREREPAPIREGLTSVAHFCVLAFVLLILYLCFKQPLEFFTWHPLLLSIGWMLLMGEAILIISKENILTRKFRITHTLKLRLHWVPLTVGAVLIAAGFLVITINKNRLNKHHYTSWHGLLGLIGVISFIIPCINGVLTLYGKELRHYINPKQVKLVHIITGSISFACGGISLILSVYTNWFRRRTDSNQYIFLFGLVTATFPVVWVLQRPTIKAVKNVYKLFSSDD